MANFISCRHTVYRGSDDAFDLLPEAGITHIEIGVPENLDFSGITALAREKGVTISTLATGLVLHPVEELARFSDLLRAFAEIEAKKMFVSVKGSDEVGRSDLIGRLRGVAEEALSLGLTLCMETHPPFGTNGNEARRTIEEVDSAGLRFNFDTANIYYYNEGADTVIELQKISEYVDSVHLKDTDGGFHSANFPVLGHGIVDFPRVFEILGARGFDGPYTLELEGPLTAGKEMAEVHEAVKGCMEYLRSIAVV